MCTPYAQKRQKLPAQGITLGYNGLKPYALKGQKLLAQGTTLGYNGLKPYALFYSNWASFERFFLTLIIFNDPWVLPDEVCVIVFTFFHEGEYDP